MNILYVMRYWPVYGGGETITVSLANKFVQQGHKVFVAYTYDKTIEPMPYSIDDRICASKMYTIEKFKKKDVDKLHLFIQKNEIDVIINQWGDTKLCDRARAGTLSKLITCWHLDVVQKEPEILQKKDRLIRKVIGEKLFSKFFVWRQLRNHQRNLKLSDRYVFLSESFEKEFLNRVGLKQKCVKTAAISNPLTYNHFFDGEKIDEKRKQVLFVGRIFEYHKRLSYVLKIWKEVESDESLCDWNLKIVGDGPDMEKTKTLALKLKLKRVSFEGFQDPNPYYAESSVFMMTSAFEGFGMTLVEALQYAVVPIAMDSYSSLHDIITHGRNGFIERNDDLLGFSKDLKFLMKNEKVRKKMAIDGLNDCRKFSIDVISAKWNTLFEDVVCIPGLR